MTRKNQFCRRGLFGLHSVFVMVSWVALWFVWPNQDRESCSISRLPGKVQMRYTSVNPNDMTLKQPTLFANEMESRLERDADPVSLMRYQPREQKRIVLEHEFEAVPDETTGVLPKDRFTGVEGSFFPDRRKKEVFGESSQFETRIEWGISEMLKELGFEVPPLPESIQNMEWGGQVVVSIELDEKGVPTHVFLEAGCKNEEVNEAVIRAMYEGKLLNVGQACIGFVTVGLVDYKKKNSN